VTESLALIVVAWLVYVSDALWWVKPERVVLSGRTPGSLRAQLGPTHVLRGESGVFLPRLTPPFDNNFEVDVTATGRKRSAEAIVAAAETAIIAARPLVHLGAVLWCYCFVITPVLIVTFGLPRLWLPVLIGLLTLAIIVVACFARQWRVLRPQNPGGWKEDAVPMILSPVAAICAADTLKRSACASFDGLAVVAALATRDDFIRIARLHYFSPGDGTAETSRLESLVDVSVLAAILEPPLPESEEMRGYCPRCHTQLVRESGDCPECHRIGIIPFGSATPSGASFDTSRSVVQR
jgi:hypothetical protein